MAQQTVVERASLFALNAGDRIEDAGVFTVSSNFSARTEAFEVVRRADGGRTITSVTIGAGASYRAEGRWDYDANERATSAVAKTSYNGVPTNIEIIATPPAATITVSAGGVRRTVPAPCDPECMIDFSPSALPMFTMTRRYDRDAGGAQSFNWIGQGLTADQTLREGVLEIRLLGTKTIGDTSVSQFYYVEKLTDDETGAVGGFAFNLWAAADHRPLAFGLVSGTLGTRDGFEFVPLEMPPIFD